MQLLASPHYYDNGSLALNAAELWLTSNTKSDAVFDVTRDWLNRRKPGAWIVRVSSYNTGEHLGYVSPED